MVGSADYAPAGLDADRSYNEMQCVLPLLPKDATSVHESKALLWCVLKRYSQFHSVFNDFAFLDPHVQFLDFRNPHFLKAFGCGFHSFLGCVLLSRYGLLPQQTSGDSLKNSASDLVCIG